MKERRRFVRIPGNLRIFYKLTHNIKTGESITEDISEGGSRFFVNEFIPKNNFLTIWITLEKTYFSFEVFGRVAWIRECPHTERHEVGVEFMNIPKEAAEALIDYKEIFHSPQSKGTV